MTAFELYRRLSGRPFGRRLFSIAFMLRAPYFRTVRPYFTQLRPNYCELRLRTRWAVHNHLGTVHAIAVANGLEAAMGALAEASVPAGRRWIPRAMALDYLALSTTDLTCIAESDPSAWQADEVEVRVRAVRTDGVEVVSGVIRLHLSDRR